MIRQASFSLACKGLLTVAAVTLMFGADRPMSQPLSKAQRDVAERIRLYDAQPIEFARQASYQDSQRGNYTQVGGKRWVF
ncbi:hypothetical protein JQR85_18835 [Stutzerimonas urumqiensis]|uniref:hypothetical protein n=1 Tax=Stutzerimonas urumqiensis TaxID=638269 RepID=UPI000EADC72C|nr:hypothetical protein [Stutzerimonas urumqiensis]